MSNLFAPKPENWTIRFKNGKSTILLHIDPDNSILQVKQHLLNVLKNLPSSSMLVESLGEFSSDPKDIIFGLPIDKNDLDQGWVPQVIPQDGSDDNADGGLNSDEEEQNILNRDCRTAGLKDGAVMAFRFKDGQQVEKGDWGVEIPKLYDEEEEEENDEDMKEGIADGELDDDDMQEAK